jgi:hypothetical protein
MADDASPKPAKKRKSAGRPQNLTNAGMGRPKGVPNKTTAILKDAILKAAEKAGKQHGSEGMVSYLEAQAMANPGPFMALLGKVLPMQVGMDPDNPLKVVHRIELVAPSGK